MITIIIPTKNRSEYLIRLLRYYADVNYPYWISIGDSSNHAHAERGKQFIEQLDGKLKINYFELPNSTISDCVRKINDSLTTPYAALIGDDDFLVCEGMEKCIDFLENNLQYTAANGRGVLLQLNGNGPYGKVVGAGEYRQNGLQDEAPSDRIVNFLNNYFVPLFSVHRSEIWRRMWAETAHNKDDSFAELIPCCLSAIQGKISHLNKLYLIRQVHKERFIMPDLYAWLTSSLWQPSFTIFERILTEQLAKDNGDNTEKARSIIKKAFWAYLANGLKSKYCSYYNQQRAFRNQAFIKGMQAFLRIIPGVESLFWNWRANSGNLSLKALLSPLSPYHKDFMPIYRFLTSQQKENEKT